MILLSLHFLVPFLPKLLLLSVSLLFGFSNSLFDHLFVSLSLFLLFLHIDLAKVCKALNHRMNLLLLLIHEHLLEGSLSGEVQVLEQISLPALVHHLLVIEHLHLLLGLEGERGRDRLGDLEGCEDSLLSLSVDSLVVSQVLRVLTLSRD